MRTAADESPGSTDKLSVSADPLPEVQKKALIYCRVSSRKQDDDGDGTRSQEHRCRQYAVEKGYVIDDHAVFHDAVTGGGDFMNRPGMVAVLRYLCAHQHGNYVVIFDDLKRFARDTEFHLRLRKTLAAHNATVECLNFKFEETPEGKFIETIIAAQGELERHQISRQTLQKMKARLERGYSVFKAPVGYRYAESPGQGMLLVKDPMLAPIVQEALEGYASGRFQQQVEVKRFLEGFAEFPRDYRHAVRNQLIHDLLRRPTYAGYLEHKGWGVALRKGQHEGLISFEVYLRIQARLACAAKVPARKGLDADFPLRGAVVCGACGASLTACWSKGRRCRYPYYLCFKRGCPAYGKSIPREVLERKFETLLEAIRPSEEGLRSLGILLDQAWTSCLSRSQERERALQQDLAWVELDMKRLLDRQFKATSSGVARAIGRRISQLELQKIALFQKIAESELELRRLGTPPQSRLRTSLQFIANPCLLWKSARLEDKKSVLKLAFGGRLAYLAGEFRTADISFIFSYLQRFPCCNAEMASLTGESSNTLLHPQTAESAVKELAEWNEYLECHAPSYREGEVV